MKFLIVEDETKTATYLSKGLKELGFTVDVALDGNAGLDLSLQYEYDLLILDVMLPGRTGWSIVEELRKQGRTTLALFLTARDSLDDRIKGLGLGGDAYLVKPFAFAELVAQIRSLLRRQPTRNLDEAIIVDDLHIDPIRRIARRANQRLDLTPKEFSLLFLLARHRGELLGRTMISEQIWNIHFDPESNVLDVHIRRLRAKVDEPFQKKLIHTVRGSGYYLDIA